MDGDPDGGHRYASRSAAVLCFYNHWNVLILFKGGLKLSLNNSFSVIGYPTCIQKVLGSTLGHVTRNNGGDLDVLLSPYRKMAALSPEMPQSTRFPSILTWSSTVCLDAASGESSQCYSAISCTGDNFIRTAFVTESSLIFSMKKRIFSDGNSLKRLVEK
jgi:hypothetical protein